MDQLIWVYCVCVCVPLYCKYSRCLVPTNPIYSTLYRAVQPVQCSTGQYNPYSAGQGSTTRTVQYNPYSAVQGCTTRTVQYSDIMCSSNSLYYRTIVELLNTPLQYSFAKLIV